MSSRVTSTTTPRRCTPRIWRPQPLSTTVDVTGTTAGSETATVTTGENVNANGNVPSATGRPGNASGTAASATVTRPCASRLSATAAPQTIAATANPLQAVLRQAATRLTPTTGAPANSPTAPTRCPMPRGPVRAERRRAKWKRAKRRKNSNWNANKPRRRWSASSSGCRPRPPPQRPRPAATPSDTGHALRGPLPQPHNRRTTPAPRNVHVRGAISTWWLQACRARPMSRNCGSKRPRGRGTWTAWAPRAMPRSKRHEPTSRGWSWSHPPGTALSTPIHFPRQVPHTPHHASPNVATFAAPTTWATPTHAQVRGGFPGPVGSAAQTAARRPADATGAQQQALTLRLPAQPLGHAGVAQPQPQFPHHALVVEPA